MVTSMHLNLNYRDVRVCLENGLMHFFPDDHAGTGSYNSDDFGVEEFNGLIYQLYKPVMPSKDKTVLIKTCSDNMYAVFFKQPCMLKRQPGGPCRIATSTFKSLRV